MKKSSSPKTCAISHTVHRTIVHLHQKLFILFSLPMPEEITNFALVHQQGAGQLFILARTDLFNLFLDPVVAGSNGV